MKTNRQLRNQRSSRGGFTLLELIVSVTLLAMIALMMTRVFNESTKAADRGTDDIALDETARFLLDVFEQDLSQALIRTNVAFRIYPGPRDGTLYFISTAVRRQHDSIARDTAPMRISVLTTGTNSSWNGYVEIETAYNASGTTPSTIGSLIRHSTYYADQTNPSGTDFGMGANSTHAEVYTQPIEAYQEDHAVVSFLDITINGDPAWNYNNPDGLPDPDSMPEFADLSIGLISAREMKMAILLNDGQRIENNERIYTRRIFMRNQGIRKLTF